MAADGKFLGGSAVTGQQKARDKYLQGPLIKTAQRSQRHPVYVPAEGAWVSERKEVAIYSAKINRTSHFGAPRIRNDEPQNVRTRSKKWRADGPKACTRLIPA